MPSGTTIGSAYVQILPSADGIKANLTKVLGGEAASAGASAGSNWASKFVSIAKKAIVAAGIGKVITSSLNMGAEFEQNLGGTEAVFGEFAENIQNKAKSAYENMGLSASDYMATANKMGSLFQGSGLEQQRALELTSQAMQRAADVASVMGLDTSMAMESIAGAAKGNFTMMDNLGVAMNATTLEAYALEKGVNFKWNTASNAEKAELAMQMFFERTQQYAGNFARESSDTFSGSLGAMKAAWQDTLTAFMTGNNLKSALNNFGETVKTFVGGNLIPAIGRMARQLPDIAGWAIDFAKSVVGELKSAISEKLPELQAVLKEKLGEDMYGVLAELGSAGKEAFEKLGTAVKFLIEHFDQLKPVLVGAAGAFAAFKIGSGIASIIGSISGIATAITAAGGLIPAITALMGPVGIVAAAIGAAIAIGVLLYQNWDTIKEKAAELGAAIQEKWEGIKAAVTEKVNTIKANVSATWESMKTAVTEKVNALKETVSAAWSNMKATYDAHGGGLTGAAAVYWENLKNIYRTGYDVINTLTGGKLDEIRDKFTSVFDRVKEIVGNAIERIKSIMDFDWHLPNLRLPHISIVGSFSLSPPSVPHFEIEWFKKAYDNPYLFTEPSVVGALGFGDGAGGEMVYGHQNLMRDIESATGGDIWEEVSSTLDQIADLLQDLRENGVMAKSYLNNRDVTDYVTMQMRRNRRAGGMA